MNAVLILRTASVLSHIDVSSTVRFEIGDIFQLITCPPAFDFLCECDINQRRAWSPSTLRLPE